MNLNSERYLAYTLDPLDPTYPQDEHLLSSVKVVWKALTNNDLADAEARLVFFATGANMGQLTRMATEEDPFAISSIVTPYSCSGKFEQFNDILNLLANVVKESILQDVDADEELLRMVAMILVRTVDPDHTIPVKRLYDAADAGAIRFDDGAAKIGFASPVVAAAAFQQCQQGEQ
jgi:hypothetical protein